MRAHADMGTPISHECGATMITLAPYTAFAAPDERGSSAVVLGAGALLSLLMLAGLRWPVLWLGVAAAIGVVALFWAARYTAKHPIWLPCALLLIDVLCSPQFIDDSVRPFLRYPLIFLFVLPACPTRWRNTMLLRGGFHLYTLYLLFAIVSTAYSIAPLNSFVRALGSIVLFGGCYTITQSVKDNQDVRRLFGCLWAGCCITLIVSAASWAFLSSDITWVAPNPGSGDSVVRFIGILGNPNEVGEFLVLTMASGLFFWPIATKQVRFGIVTSLAAALLFTILADSRSHTVACAIGLFAFTLDRYRWRAIAVWLPLGVIAVGCALLLSPDKLDYLNRGDVMTLTGRTEIWRFTIDKIKERPILGYGYEVEGQIFQDRHFPLWEEMWETGPHIPVHNGYLSLAVGSEFRRSCSGCFSPCGRWSGSSEGCPITSASGTRYFLAQFRSWR